MSDHTYANSFQAQPRPGLERIRHLMGQFADVQDTLSCIHIAGTNGKGSVAVFLDSILTHAGYRVGRYTSPNLVRVNERIAVGGEPIGDADLDRLLTRVEGAAAVTLRETGEQPSQFEIWTAAAFLYFAEQKCDYVVLEAGMGGAYDATNVIARNVIGVLTRIDLDHTRFLGSTPAEIARTKCGIIKSDCLTHTVVSAPQLPEVQAVIEEEAANKGCHVCFAEPPAPRKHYGMQEVFYFPGYGDIRCGLPGIHQIENACVALACARLLHVDIFDAQCGVTYARHPGRMEILRRDPLLLYDGGHNPAGIRTLAVSLVRYLGDGEKWCIYACMRDKDYREGLRILSGIGCQFIFTSVRGNPRALPAAELQAAAAEIGISGACAPTLADAIRMTDTSPLPVIICGSLYLYADLPDSLRGV